jgi:hypothetical protein
MTQAERKVICEMKKVVEERPETKEPSVGFIRDWAFGNAGIENESITRPQVERVIKEHE